MTSQQQRKDIIYYRNSGFNPMQIKICHCTPHWAQVGNLAFRARSKKTSQNKLSQSGCNGPRSGIETHPQGLKCWTCGETADAIDCTEFPYDSRDHQDKEDVSGNHNSKLDGQPRFLSMLLSLCLHFFKPSFITPLAIGNVVFCGSGSVSISLAILSLTMLRCEVHLRHCSIISMSFLFTVTKTAPQQFP